MKLSTKGRYAMVALCDIALQGGPELVTLSDISKRQKNFSNLFRAAVCKASACKISSCFPWSWWWLQIR
jgi:DNA-binding IscR family transcriptional regulator